MKDIPPQQVALDDWFPRTRRRLLAWLCLLASFLIPLLACNLPARQVIELPFSTDHPRISPTVLPFVAGPTESSLGFPEVTVLPGSPESGQSAYLFLGMQTATPGAGSVGVWPTLGSDEILPPFTYITQPGDTLSALATRFGVHLDQISPAQPPASLLESGQVLKIPNLLGEPPYSSALLPDSAVIYSPLSSSFKVGDYIAQAGGFLHTYSEKVDDEWLSGTEIVQRVAIESSINPELLLAFLEHRSGWVRGQPHEYTQLDYPIGFYVPDYKGLYLELSLVAKELNIGYYGWRQGTLTELTFPDYSQVRLSPGLNAGTVSLQVLTSLLFRQQSDWLQALYGPHGLAALYAEMFGDPWQAASLIEPLFPAGLSQPTLELPFSPGEYWSLTSGPHIAWRTGTPRGALDFAPITGETPCAVSRAWVRASASGRVVRSERGVVALDLDGDGLEQTGWVLIYMHIAEQDRALVGIWVETDTPIGHPSCEGGTATGTNVHLARKFNGEWLAADGPLPMVLSGWIAHQGQLSYEGTLEKDGQIVSARPDGSTGSTIIR